MKVDEKIDEKSKPALTVQDIAEQLNVTDATVRMWIAKKQLPAYILPGAKKQPIYRVPVEGFEKFLKKRSNTVCA